MSNPFNEARREQLKTDAQELLTVFGKEYLKSYGMSMLEKIRAELEGEGKDIKKLHYREWDAVERPVLFSGWCYVKTGAGPGDFGKWKKVFIAERQDYSIGVFASDKDYEKGKLPKKVISTCGYHLERDVSWFYRCELKAFFSGLGMTESEMEVITSFSEYSWALVHPWRPNFVFQIHKGKDAACPCFGGNVVEPEGAGSENAEAREGYLEAFDRMVSKAKVRNTEELTGAAFEMTCGKLRSKMDRLWWWEDDGLEGQMLCDALMVQCLLPMRDDMLADLTGPMSMKTVAWFKTRGMVYTTLEAMVNPAWSQVQVAAGKVGEKIEPVLRKGLGPIFSVKKQAKDKLRSAVTDKLGAALSKNVTPFVDPIFKSFDKPLTKAHAAAKEAFDKEVVVSKIPDDTKEMRIHLDAIPRAGEAVTNASKACAELIEPLRQIQKLNDDIFGSINVFEWRSNAESSVLRTMDAAIYKLENMIEEQGKGGAENFKQQILKEYDHDVMVARASFMKVVCNTLLVGNFKRLTAKITDPALEALNNVIPEDMQDFLDLGGILDEIIDLFVAEPIDQMVDAAYPLPKG